MARTVLLTLAALPVLAALLPWVVPSPWLDPYAWWDPVQLNSPNIHGRPRRWLNMGYWQKGTEEFSAAAEALAQHLLAFADVEPGGRILDVAHGPGESLLLHLSHDHPPSHLDALTSLRAHSSHAQALVSSYIANHTSIRTTVGYHTAPAIYSATNSDHHDHPLNPMRGFVGRPHAAASPWDADEDDGDGAGDTAGTLEAAAGAKYTLIYVLDAIYHFAPSRTAFQKAALAALEPGRGVLAYTDIIPPANLKPIMARVLSVALSIPLANLVSRPESLRQYRRDLMDLGYEDVRLEDISVWVWDGFSRNLRRRGGPWAYVARVVERAGKDGWRFIVVRGQRPTMEES